MTIRPLLCISLFLLIGCASTGLPETAVRRSQTGELFLLQVPFFPQPEGLCGPASLASVFHYWKKEISVKEIEQAIYLPQLSGVLGIDLTRFAREKGFRANAFSGTLPELRDRLAEGIPLIAFLNLGNRYFPVGHFIVVTGFDEAREEVIVHSGSEPNKAVPYRTFLAAWEKTGSWTLQVLPPGPL